MEDSHPETIPHGCFFVYKGYRQTILSLYATTLGEIQNSPYLLGIRMLNSNCNMRIRYPQ